MLRRVRIEEAGDVEFLPMVLFDRIEFEEINARTTAAGGRLGRHLGGLVQPAAAAILARLRSVGNFRIAYSTVSR